MSQRRRSSDAMRETRVIDGQAGAMYISALIEVFGVLNVRGGIVARIKPLHHYQAMFWLAAVAGRWQADLSALWALMNAFLQRETHQPEQLHSLVLCMLASTRVDQRAAIIKSVVQTHARRGVRRLHTIVRDELFSQRKRVGEGVIGDREGSWRVVRACYNESRIAAKSSRRQRMPPLKARQRRRAGRSCLSTEPGAASKTQRLARQVRLGKPRYCLSDQRWVFFR